MATISFDIPANDIPRVQEAFGVQLDLGRPANQAEVTQATKRYVIDTTQNYERRKNAVTFTPPPMEMN